MTVRPDAFTARHGGDLALATARYGTPPQGWLDLSTGINPTPYPAPSIPVARCAALPDAGALAALIDAAREAYRVPSSISLISVPGSEMALRLLPYAIPEGKVAIVGPTYRSHYEAWSNAGRTVLSISTLDQLPPETTNVVAANPNNPDGRSISNAELARSAAAVSERGAMLVVDEAFADLDPTLSLVPFLDQTPAVVLRSFGKFFGLPGLRLGFVAGPRVVVDRLAHLLGDWPVSAPAIDVGRMALKDHAWQAETRIRLRESADRLRALLTRHGLNIAGGTDLFVLVETPEADALHHCLAQAGIWTRLFDYRHDWIRIGLPGNAASFTRLDTALGGIPDCVDR